QIGGKEMEIGCYYQRAGQWLAAAYHFCNVGEKYQTTRHTPEALGRLVECNLALGLPDEARKNASVLGANFPDTYWYMEALKVLGQETRRTERTASRK